MFWGVGFESRIKFNKPHIVKAFLNDDKDPKIKESKCHLGLVKGRIKGRKC